MYTEKETLILIKCNLLIVKQNLYCYTYMY